MYKETLKYLEYKNYTLLKDFIQGSVQTYAVSCFKRSREQYRRISKQPIFLAGIDIFPGKLGIDDIQYFIPHPWF